MGRAARGDRSGENAADAACQCDHRRRRGEARAGRGGNRKISRRPISCSIAPAVPQQLRERQAAHWDPVLAWARDTLGAHFKLGEGVVHVAQPEAALKAAAAAIPTDPWRLGAVHVITTLTGSALIALAVARGALSADAAWQAAHVDEDWNMAQWGKDEMAMQRRAFRHAEFAAAAGVLRELAE